MKPTTEFKKDKYSQSPQ